MSGPVVLWFRQDLRLDDNRALARAAATGPVVPLFIWAPEEEDRWPLGAASRWWLHHALVDLDTRLRGRGLRLIIRRGGSLEVLRQVVAQTGARGVCWNRRYEPWAIARDARIKAALSDDGLEVGSENSRLLVEPWTVATTTGQPFRVFTPFSRAVLAKALPEPEPLVDPRPPTVWPESLTVDDLGLLPKIPWDGGFHEAWDPTRAGAEARLKILDTFVQGYHESRDLPGEDGTSRLSPYLAHGQIGPREIVARLGAQAPGRGAETFLREILWREFAYHILYHFPGTIEEPLQPRFREFPAVVDRQRQRAWQRGRTGYPLVDAGMLQLWATGWMHNRVRMNVASFFVKHLLQPWQDGARWFWDTLVDADLASNTLGWQWAAGCGADAAPYFRIFNPHLQAAKFDPDGRYSRRWVPEMSGAGGYPAPLVDHGEARQRALDAYAALPSD